MKKIAVILLIALLASMILATKVEFKPVPSPGESAPGLMHFAWWITKPPIWATKGPVTKRNKTNKTSRTSWLWKPKKKLTRGGM